MPVAEEQTEYKNLLTTQQPVEVWIPNGSYTAPRRIDTNKMPVNTTLPEVILEAGGRNPRQRILTSGEWHRIRENLQRTNAKVEEGMITGPYERTSTILDYTHGRKGDGDYFCGLLIQIPEVVDDGNFAEDEKGILKARYIWEMALPIKSDHVKNMPPELDPFLDTIYGMKEARKILPDYAYFYMEKPEGLISLLRGDWAWPDRGRRRVDVFGAWRPLNPGGCVAARAAVEGGVIYELYDVDFETAMRLLKEAKQAPLPDVSAKIDEAKEVFSRARIRHEA